MSRRKATKRKKYIIENGKEKTKSKARFLLQISEKKENNSEYI